MKTNLTFGDLARYTVLARGIVIQMELFSESVKVPSQGVGVITPRLDVALAVGWAVAVAVGRAGAGLVLQDPEKGG